MLAVYFYAYYFFVFLLLFFFFSSRRRHTRSTRDWSSDVCSSDLGFAQLADGIVYAVDRGLVVLAQLLPVAAPDPLQLRRLGRHRRRHHRRQVTNHQHVRPAGAWVAAGNVPVVLREEHHTLEFRKPGEQFERRGADIAVVFRSLVAPGVVSQTAERHEQADEGDGIVAQLLAKAGHWPLHSSIDPSLNLRGHRLHSADFAACAPPARRYTRQRTHGWRTRGYAAQTSSCLQLTRLLSARARAGIQAQARKGHPDQAYL